jgi:hypothetical protein
MTNKRISWPAVVAGAMLLVSALSCEGLEDFVPMPMECDERCTEGECAEGLECIKDPRELPHDPSAPWICRDPDCPEEEDCKCPAGCSEACADTADCVDGLECIDSIILS